GNGELHDEWLCKIGVGIHKLRSGAGVSCATMIAACKKDTGKDLAVTDSDRALESQVSVAARKPGFAARPGTSNHGWGLALDLGGNPDRKRRAVRLAGRERERVRLGEPGLGQAELLRALALGIRSRTQGHEGRLSPPNLCSAGASVLPDPSPTNRVQSISDCTRCRFGRHRRTV